MWRAERTTEARRSGIIVRRNKSSCSIGLFRIPPGRDKLLVGVIMNAWYSARWRCRWLSWNRGSNWTDFWRCLRRNLFRGSGNGWRNGRFRHRHLLLCRPISRRHRLSQIPHPVVILLKSLSHPRHVRRIAADLVGDIGVALRQQFIETPLPVCRPAPGRRFQLALQIGDLICIRSRCRGVLLSGLSQVVEPASIGVLSCSQGIILLEGSRIDLSRDLMDIGNSRNCGFGRSRSRFFPEPARLFLGGLANSFHRSGARIFYRRSRLDGPKPLPSSLALADHTEATGLR